LWLNISSATKKIIVGGITDELEYCNNSFHSSYTSSVDSGVWKKSTFVCDPYANLAKSSCGLLLVDLPHKIENKNLDSSLQICKPKK
jgi:hypothetical protein